MRFHGEQSGSEFIGRVEVGPSAWADVRATTLAGLIAEIVAAHDAMTAKPTPKVIADEPPPPPEPASEPLTQAPRLTTRRR